MLLPGVVPGLQCEGEAGTALCQTQPAPAWGREGTTLLVAANRGRNSLCASGEEEEEEDKSGSMRSPGQEAALEQGFPSALWKVQLVQGGVEVPAHYSVGGRGGIERNEVEPPKKGERW